MYDITHKTPGIWVQFGEGEIISDMLTCTKLKFEFLASTKLLSLESVYIYSE